MLAVADSADSIDYFQHNINTRSDYQHCQQVCEVRVLGCRADGVGGDGPLRGGAGPLRGGVGPLRGSQLTTVFTTCAATRHCGNTAVQSSFLKPSLCFGAPRVRVLAAAVANADTNITDIVCR